MDRVPVLDLNGDGCSSVIISKRMDGALRRYGFFYVTNHGVPEALIREQFDVAAKLFALPMETKLSMPFDPILDVGYLASGGQAVGLTKQLQQQQQQTMTTAAAGQIDTKEQFMMTNNKLITTTGSSSASASTSDNNGGGGGVVPLLDENVDPDDDVFAGSTNYNVSEYVPDHGRVTSAYMSAAYKLNLRLQNYLFDALSLDDGDGNGNDESTRQRLGAHPFLVLKQMKYDAGRDGLPSDPSVGRYGAGPHTDWGSFTILATDQTPGLQIYMPECGGGTWLDVPPIPGTLIVNAGDQISILTNGMYRSALHRVIITDKTVGTPRYSTAVFAYFGMDATFRPLPKFVAVDDKDDEIDDPSGGRTTREYFHFKLHQSVFGLADGDTAAAAAAAARRGGRR